MGSRKADGGEDMSGGPPRAQVFISCGQSGRKDEAQVARDIAARLEKLGFETYIAIAQQTLRGLKENIFDELRRSEYLVFVDFKREKLGRSQYHRGSLFSHQELAVASLFEIEIAAFQER